MIKSTQIKKRMFLRRFHLTAQEAFGSSWQSRIPAAKLLIDIARAHFRMHKSQSEIYRDLSGVWKKMRRVKRSRWHGNVETISAGFD